MKKLFRSISITSALVLLGACGSLNSVEHKGTDSLSQQSKHSLTTVQTSAELSVATWNVEHLAYPIDQGCRPRTELELKALRTYAQSLDVDVVALQEVASKEAVHLLFPQDQWTVVMSARADSKRYECRGSGNLSTQQKTAIAVKKGIAIANVEQNSEFSLDNPGLRFGLGISVVSEFGQIDILNLHLKSGCFVDDYLKSDSPACLSFSQQADILYNWVAQREQTHRPYIILGDFNHRISAPYNRMNRRLLQNANESYVNKRIATASLIGCHPRYPAPIDHIVVAGLKSEKWDYKPEIHRFEDMQEEVMLSDHCAVSLRLSKQTYPLSTAVKWQTESKEYEIITKGLYKNASISIENMKLPNNPWVVIMDLDETVLDNSAYQVALDRSNGSYSTESWNNWVKSGKATLVPGVNGFIQTVLHRGGKLVFITNRDKSLDNYTWANILDLGLAVNQQNTCLIGRSEADKISVKTHQYINDKDLRRESIASGNPSCFTTNKANLSRWQSPHTIVMQVGDNIEDVNEVSQEDANIDALLPRLGKEIVILPNPMYGSWN